MSTAILISGQTRTFRHVIKNQWWYVLRHYAHAHVFASVADDADAKDLQKLRDYFPAHRIHVEHVTQPNCTELLGMSDETAKRAATGAAMGISSPPEGILRQLWHLARVWDFHNAERGETAFDYYIRLRPDLHFHRFVKPPNPFRALCLTPWWGGYGGVNDRFAVMGCLAAAEYFNTWRRIPELLKAGCPLHPETMVGESLIPPIDSKRTLQAEFSAVRPTGELVWPDMQPFDQINYARQC